MIIIIIILPGSKKNVDRKEKKGYSVENTGKQRNWDEPEIRLNS